MQIIVLGTHRSGTSLVTRMLNLMGAYLGSQDILLPPKADNPKGFWERKDVLKLNDAILNRLDSNWYSISRVIEAQSTDKSTNSEIRRFFEEKAAPILNDLEQHRPWALKDPRMCLLLPLWHTILHQPVHLFVDRNPLQIAQSLKQRNGFPIPFGIALWESYATLALNGSVKSPSILVKYEDIIRDPQSTASEILERLTEVGLTGLHLPTEKELQSILDEKLVHHRNSADMLGQYLTSHQLRLWQEINEGNFTHRFQPLRVSEHATETILQFESLQYSQLKQKEVVENLAEVETSLRHKEQRLAEAYQDRDSARKDSEDKTKKVEETTRELRAAREKVLQKEIEITETTGKLRNVRKELSQLNAEAEKTVTELTTTRKKLKQKETESVLAARELSDVRNHLERKEVTLAAAEQKLDVVRKDLTAAVQEAAQLKQHLEKNDYPNKMKLLREEIYKRKKDIAALSGWLIEVREDVAAVNRSWRWRLGNAVLAPTKFLLRRHDYKTSFDHLDDVFDEFKKWSAQYVRETGGEAAVTPPASFPPVSFKAIIAAALKKPALTLQLLNVERIKNLYITLFKKDRSVRENVFRYYWDLFQENRGLDKKQHNERGIV